MPHNDHLMSPKRFLAKYAFPKTWIIIRWYNPGKNEWKVYRRQKKNAPAERPGERKVCSRRQERVAEIKKSWKSYTCLSVDYLRKEGKREMLFPALPSRHNGKTMCLHCTVSWQIKKQLECGPMPNVMVALPNIGGALCSTSQSLADTHYLTAVQ